MPEKDVRLASSLKDLSRFIQGLSPVEPIMNRPYYHSHREVTNNGRIAIMKELGLNYGVEVTLIADENEPYSLYTDDGERVYHGTVSPGCQYIEISAQTTELKMVEFNSAVNARLADQKAKSD